MCPKPVFRPNEGLYTLLSLFSHVYIRVSSTSTHPYIPPFSSHSVPRNNTVFLYLIILALIKLLSFLLAIFSHLFPKCTPRNTKRNANLGYDARVHLAGNTVPWALQPASQHPLETPHIGCCSSNIDTRRINCAASRRHPITNEISPTDTHTRSRETSPSTAREATPRSSRLKLSASKLTHRACAVKHRTRSLHSPFRRQLALQ